MSDERRRIEGTAVRVRGDDIDTDRIIPARFLKAIVFDGLGEHAFADDRRQASDRGALHPFDDPRFAGASVLVVDSNFGCGSSREHAPQALLRRGIRAIVGESFAEIFFGNCVTLGIPCVTCSPQVIAHLADAIEAEPQTLVTVDVEAATVTAGGRTHDGRLPDGPRRLLVEGRWDSTAELLEAKDAIACVAASLPYFDFWR